MNRMSIFAFLAAAFLPVAAQAFNLTNPTGRFVNKSIADMMHMGSSMQLSSPAFQNGASIPARYVRTAAGGENVSIPVQWRGVPAGTKSLALSIVDHNPVARMWVHWMVIDIPAGTRSLDAGASGRHMPPGAVELANSFGDVGYGGPQPPQGSGPHPYVITLYALNVARLDLKPHTSLAGFRQALMGKTLGKASLTGYYQK